VNDAQRILVVGLLLMAGATMSCAFLNFGQGAFIREDRIAILVLFCHGKYSTIGPGYGLYTTNGVPGVLFGLIAPIFLFAISVFVALGARKRD
jgi:hypothetical protein